MGPVGGHIIDRLVPWYASLFGILMLVLFQSIQVGAGGISVAAVIISTFGLDIFRQMVQVSLTTTIFGYGVHPAFHISSSPSPMFCLQNIGLCESKTQRSIDTMRKKYPIFRAKLDLRNSCRFSLDRSSEHQRALKYSSPTVGVPAPLSRWVFTPGQSSFYQFVGRTANDIPGSVMKEVLRRGKRRCRNETV